jgi:hypothetical protein
MRYPKIRVSASVKGGVVSWVKRYNQHSQPSEADKNDRKISAATRVWELRAHARHLMRSPYVGMC